MTTLGDGMGITMVTDQINSMFAPLSCGCDLCAGKSEFGLSQFKLSQFELREGFRTGVDTGTPSYISALLPSDLLKWGPSIAGSSAVVTYSFMVSAPSYADDDERFGFSAMNTAQRVATVQALNAWAEVAGIAFVEVSDAGDGGFIRFGTNDQLGISSGYAYYPGTSDASGDVYIANDQAVNQSPVAGDYGYLTLLHEIGHALGLKHPGNYSAGGGGTEGPYLPNSEDSEQYTLMSYNDHPGVSTYSQGPGIYDIAAIQYLYGANTAANAGDNIYTLNDTQNPMILTIWDTNGTDTIDFSEQKIGAEVSLLAGSFSSIGPSGSGGRAADNLAVAFGVTLENVIAGSGDDVVTGNAANNVFVGGLGNDQLDGGAGTDAAVFTGAQAAYSWTRSGDFVNITGPDGIDTLSNLEILRFDDVSVNLLAENPVYRFYNSLSDTHFYTGSLVERDGIINTVPSFVYEGPNFATSSSGDQSVWRFYNTTTDSHFYTISVAERDWITANMPTFSFEGEAYRASETPVDGMGPLYRFLNTQNGSHFFTASALEASLVEATIPHFEAEGVAYYVGLL
jgi:serralysin